SKDIETAKASLVSFFQAEERIQTFLNHKFPSLQKRAEKALELGHGMLSAIQADIILKMRLQALTGLEREKLETGYLELMEEIKGYEELLADEKKIYAKIREDTLELKKKFADPRRTQIDEAAMDFTMEELIPYEDYAVTISEGGYIKRVLLSTYRQQGRGGKGVKGADTKEGDVLDQVLIAHSHDYILFFTDKGRMFARKVYEIPEMSRTAPGRSIANLLDLEKEESVTSLLTIPDIQDPSKYIMMITERGYIKKTPLDLFSNVHNRGIVAIRLEEGDRLIETLLTTGEDRLVIGTRKGKALLFEEKDVRPMGRTARGVRGIRLKGDDQVCGLVRVEEGHTLLTISEKGYGKRTPFEEYRQTRRGGQGVINMKTTAKNGMVIGLHAVKDQDDLVLITSQGKIIRISASSIRLCGRNALGVRLIRLDQDDILVSSAKIENDNGEKEEKKETRIDGSDLDSNSGSTTGSTTQE
ncbi:MAG: DNA gyrase subunit A, partial [Planctomycetota bacterium]